MESTRQQKVARLVQRELADYFIRHGRDFVKGGMVSVTQVRVSPDLSIARVYLSLMGGGSAEESLQRIEESKSKIRYSVGQSLGKSLRIVPDLHFFHDDSAAYADRIEQLLSKTRKNEEDS
jgi:ribosome-binding factor A